MIPVPIMISKHGAVLILLLVCMLVLSGVRGETPERTSDTQGRSGMGFIQGDALTDLNRLLSFTQNIGLNISAEGSGESLISMTDRSLTRIIDDLSSGKSEGFTTIPLIQEFFRYFGIQDSDILVNPDNITGSMRAIDEYGNYTRESKK
jgi:hypothetical protein